jgi:Flp pilus assembly protein TadD
MSLIHEALKKAEKKPADEAKAPSVLPSFEPAEKKKLNARTIGLIVVLVFAIILALYLRLTDSSKKKATVEEQTTQTKASAEQMSQVEVQCLKKSAQEAFSSGDMNQAWAILTAADQIKANDPEVLNNLGLVAKRRGDFQEAKKFYDRALKLQPDYPECLNNLVVVEMDEGNFESAKKTLTRALAIRPNFADASFNMAVAYEREGNNKEADLDRRQRFIIKNGIREDR